MSFLEPIYVVFFSCFTPLEAMFLRLCQFVGRLRSGLDKGTNQGIIFHFHAFAK